MLILKIFWIDINKDKNSKRKLKRDNNASEVLGFEVIVDNIV